MERLLAEVIDELGIEDYAIGVTGVGCHARLCLPLDIDVVQVIHGRAVDAATGIKHALNGKPIVFTIQGDGDCASIGIEGLLGACHRCERISIFMLNNTNYGTTGGQMSPTTLIGQKTTSTIEGRNSSHGYPFHVPELIATMRGVCYAARGALTTAEQSQQTKKFIKKAFQKQMDNLGMSFVEILVACPTNWKMKPVESLKWIQEKVIKEFPIGEFKDVDKT
jgi:2-oxoglutarate ferredoxin oxidoreductase subunit beta